MLRAALILSACLVCPAASFGQDAATTDELYGLTEGRPVAAQNQDRCITQMAEFPTDDPTARYQFFKLVSDVAYGADRETRALFDHYGQPAVSAGTPVLSVIEDIANPVLRQAAPEIIVSSMNYLVDFAVACDVYITGQTDSLLAFDGTLANPDLNTAIAEDALFLRQILSESLSRLGADGDTNWANAASSYSRSLVAQRDAVEYAAFETDIAELETLFMDDLDGRLARSNDVINSEMDREILGDAIQLSDDLNEAAKERARQERLYRLLRLFGGGR
ncbi:MAG: hypothetical protein ABJO36_13230 [Litorimonas sp.]